MKKRHITLFTAIAAAAAFASSAQAAVILGDTSTAKNEAGTRFAANISNDNGLTGSGATGTFTSPWVNGWQGNGGFTNWARVDLGATYTVDTMHVWNYHEQEDSRGMRDTNIYYSTVETADASNFASGDWTLFVAKTMTVGWTGVFGPYTPTDNIAMGGLTARVIGIEILNSVSDANNVGIGKLQFDGTLVSELSADPEITSITSLGGGNWELKLKGENNTSYQFFSSPTLDFDTGDLVTGLTATVGDISGDSDEFVTTNGDGDATVQMALTGSPADFVRAQTQTP
jgi:hypothetical protein